jgi:pimeloyl-ACP methyl ester carboxylesterase
MCKKRTGLRRLFRVMGTLVLIGVIGLYLVLPAAMGVFAVLPSNAQVGAPPDGFESITITTADGVALAGWFAPSANGAAIVLLHGAGGSRESVRAYAVMLHRHGYGVLAVDARGHGESGGRVNRLGWRGLEDVQAVVKHLEESGIERIGGLGLSMGGEMLLGAASATPGLRAIITDGATRRCTEELLALPSERPLVRNFTARVMYATVQLLSGDTPPTPLLDSMLASQQVPYLLIVAGENELEVAFNQLFADALGSRAQLWIVPGATHTGGFALSPEEYEDRVLSFFDRMLLDSDGP